MFTRAFSISILVIISCKGRVLRADDTEQPHATVGNFVEQLKNRRFQKAKAYCDEKYSEKKLAKYFESLQRSLKAAHPEMELRDGLQVGVVAATTSNAIFLTRRIQYGTGPDESVMLVGWLSKKKGTWIIPARPEAATKQ